jgi:glutamyl-Q tRNA(Asp) synthetase
MTSTAYRGRFAPSPSGPLHAGSLAAALASWLDARAHGGMWHVRIEDVDSTRCIAGMDRVILGQLVACGLLPDAAVSYQSQRLAGYGAALQALLQDGRAYPCGCTRKEIEGALPPRLRHGERVYPGTCRSGLHGKAARAVRLRVQGSVAWVDRRLGAQNQDLEHEVGDFVLLRADGLWAYQLAVVVDDAAQGITHVVRGEDLADNTPRQIALQRALGLATPSYLHTPLVLGRDGAKLSKQNGAQAIDATQPLAALQAAGAALDLPVLAAATVPAWLAAAVPAWAGIIAA